MALPLRYVSRIYHSVGRTVALVVSVGSSYPWLEERESSLRTDECRFNEQKHAHEVDSKIMHVSG